MNLFERVPDNFFSILSSKNKEVYVDALMLLHRLFQHELNIETGVFLAELVGLLENRIYELEDDDEIPEGGLTMRGKARLILNRLVTTGWLDREDMEGSFTEVITPRDCAIQVIKLLHDLSVYQSIPDIVNEIDRKHNTYVKLSIDTIKYRMTADQSIGGKLADILKKFSTSSGILQSKAQCFFPYCRNILPLQAGSSTETIITDLYRC